MPRNIEIKARISSVAALLPAVQRIADEGPSEILQEDTYFACPTGRLKLRKFSATAGELIYYRRDPLLTPKESYYLRSGTTAPESLRLLLTTAYGEVGRVAKRRTLFMAGRTRIHLDEVSGLGDFLELEVMLEQHEPAAAGVREADGLLARLGVHASQLIAGGYADLLAAGGSPPPPRPGA